jgi:hypothetical protein
LTFNDVHFTLVCGQRLSQTDLIELYEDHSKRHKPLLVAMGRCGLTHLSVFSVGNGEFCQDLPSTFE